jgi:SAM-dependent methyltransferase
MGPGVLVMLKSAERFSSRIEHYVKYRPGYPCDIVDELTRECQLTPESIVADIGSGTGKSAEPFLQNGNVVLGVEPNPGMRKAAEEIFRDLPRFKSVEGNAESTTLPDGSIDFVVAAQAFHWFDQAKFRIEAKRILKPKGWLVLFWNGRKLKSTPFLEDYEKLMLKFGTDYQDVRHENIERHIPDFFKPDYFIARVFPNQQVFDLDGLHGRVRSSSYTPEPDDPKFPPMMARLNELFDKYQRNGTVLFEYDTRVFYGQLS